MLKNARVATVISLLGNIMVVVATVAAILPPGN